MSMLFSMAQTALQHFPRKRWKDTASIQLSTPNNVWREKCENSICLIWKSKLKKMVFWENFGVLGKVLNITAHKKSGLSCWASPKDQSGDSNRPCCQLWSLTGQLLHLQDASDGDRAGHLQCARKMTVLQPLPRLLEGTVLALTTGRNSVLLQLNHLQKQHRLH